MPFIISYLLAFFLLFSSQPPAGNKTDLSEVTFQDSIPHYPQDYFVSPIKHTIRLSGTFGELRSNHFHSGIDIKSANGKVGDPIYATADGYISRIKIQSGAYGNAIYIDHPNDYTTLYAHLYEFTPKVQKWLQEQQIKAKSFEIDKILTSDLFPVKQGDIIGKMGTSGRSFGPHLHFEIRDTKTQETINPLHFGLRIKDTRPPRMHQLKVYALDEKTQQIYDKIIQLRAKTKFEFTTPNDTIYLEAYQVGLALKVYDHHNDVTNWNGIYSLTMTVDDIKTYKFSMDQLNFSNLRYINAHIDYKEQFENEAYFNRTFLLPGNNNTIYQAKINNGIIKINSTTATKVELVATDIYNNKSELTLHLKQKTPISQRTSNTFHYYLPFQEAHKIQTDYMDLYMSKGTLYRDLAFVYTTSKDQSEHYYSHVHHLHFDNTPVHKYYDLGIKPTKIIDSKLKSKAFIAYCYNQKIISFGGTWKGDKLTTKVRDLGNFSIMIDTIPPTIQPIDFSTDLRGYNKISFQIKDQLITDRSIKQLQYSTTIDGKWVLFSYDAKNHKITYNLKNNQLSTGIHKLHIIVTDHRGNTTEFLSNFKL